jgi:hypothetical protein
MFNVELAVISLASLKDGGSSQGTFWSIHPQQNEGRSSSPASTTQEPLPLQECLPTTDDTSVSSSVSTSVSPRPLRMFSRATRGLDVFSSIQAAQNSGLISKPTLELQTNAKGVDQAGLPPQQ